MNTTTQLQPTTNRINTIHGAAVQVGIEQLKVIQQMFDDSGQLHMQHDIDTIQHVFSFELFKRSELKGSSFEHEWIRVYPKPDEPLIEICLDDHGAIQQLQDVITEANKLLGHNVIPFMQQNRDFAQLGNPISKHAVLPPVVAMVSGKTFNLIHPEESEFDIEDVAHHLSMICRFNGGTTQFYSVAQHSVLVSHLVPPYLELSALLHDVAEAYLGDCTTPFKQLLSEYKQIENNILQNIFNRLGLDFPLHSEIKRADIRARATEVRDLTLPALNRKTWDHLKGVSASEHQIFAMEPQEAKQAFLDRYFEIQAKRLNAQAKA
jgi:hypothetical protein